MTKRSLYVVCKTLDQPTRIVGLPVDEFIIAEILMGIFIFMGKLILSMGIAIPTVVLIRVMKKGHGAGWLLNVLYWYLPQNLTKVFVRFTPASHQREWIS